MCCSSNIKRSDSQKGGAEGDEQLRQRFENEIMPKIQEQLKVLDQNEQPNTVTIELKRQLRVRFKLSLSTGCIQFLGIILRWTRTSSPTW